ncbi:MAG: cbb3-type cytochrome c oxidase subunit I [Verrucomicrobiales bacterium]
MEPPASLTGSSTSSDIEKVPGGPVDGGGHDGHDHSGNGGHDGHHEHKELGFWRKYIFSTDHKVIGIQYMLTGLVFMFVGFALMLVMRYQLAYPDQPIPGIQQLAESVELEPGTRASNPIEGLAESFPGGVMTPNTYNAFGAMHGTIMVFLAIVPVAFAAFGNYVVPLQIGAPDMCFPKLNAASYWTYAIGGVVMVYSFFVPGGAAKSGWTMYPPLSTVTSRFDDVSPWFTGETLWLLGMVFLITSSLLGSVNFICTIVQLRAKGMTWFRMPFFVWAMLVTAFLLLLAFPPLEAAALMQLMDRVAGTSFFMPSGLVVDGIREEVAGGGSPLLWQHLFWFLAHPEVYVLILPALGIVAEVLTNNTRKPLWGYRLMIYSILVLGFLSFVVWAHHMYLTGMGTTISTFFQTTTVLISIPSVILLTCLLISLWGGSIRFPTPMLFACAFLPMFGLGGLTGIPLAFNATDIVLHDTYYVIAHFHYIVAPGTIFAIFAGIYYWFPKATGRMMHEGWGKFHFWSSLIFMNGIFLPMFYQGLAGMHRRWHSGGQNWVLVEESGAFQMNEVTSWAAWLLGVVQVPFMINFFYSIWHGRKVGRNPWNSTTLEWAAPSPPPHGNFDQVPSVYRGPYEYSLPLVTDRDFVMQQEDPIPGEANQEKPSQNVERLAPN